MNEDFVPYELAVKLKEKGFTCEYPFAMYNKYEQFCPLYTSDKYHFEIDDFSTPDYIAPTISQVLKWLREEHQIHIYIDIVSAGWVYNVLINVKKFEDGTWWYNGVKEEGYFDSFEQTSLAGIEYVIDNLI